MCLLGCGFDPARPFERRAPEVEKALSSLDAGNARASSSLLESYLGTGSCADGGFGVPERVRQRPFASFDLGLSQFQVGEHFGRRFGEEEQSGDAGPTPEEQQLAELRQAEVECALRAVLAITTERDVPTELRARAQYLAGNLEFLRRGYQEAVRHYDEALKLVPGLPDGGDTIGRDAAWNRAIALLRIEEDKKKDAGADAPPEDAARNDAQSDSGRPGDSGKPDPQQDAGNHPPEAGPPQPQDAAPPEPQPADAAAPEPNPQQPPPTVNQDERMLDMLESAPTFQEQDAKNRGAARKHRGKIDK